MVDKSVIARGQDLLGGAVAREGRKERLADRP